MSAEQYTHIEQDRNAPPGDDDLPPSYDDLAAQNGPNSRFGRWRGWIEKRAAERYVDITPQERQRRKERGWELQDPGGTGFEASIPPAILYTKAPSPFPHGEGSLHILTNNLSIDDTVSIRSLESEVQLPFISETISPSHLKINHFGSRFLPHTTSQIRCILPLLADRMVLIGHDEGLSVLDMFPQDGLSVKRPNEAQAYVVWRGETVYQMTILELEETSDATPQGVVLALVGPEPNSTSNSDFHILRMYNLSSLTSLARWAIKHKGARPLDLDRPSNWQNLQQSPSRRHRPQGSIARSIKSLIDSPPHQQEQPTSYHTLLKSTTSTIGPSFARGRSPAAGRVSPTRHSSSDSWDVVDELPLRWATDYVALASPGSRLSSTSVQFYATWYDQNRRSTGGQLLAIATKNAILLYESPRGERAYRFLKDFYTPFQPRGLCFFDQHVQQEPSRASSESHRHRRNDSGNIRPTNEHGHMRSESQSGSNTVSYGIQLCLFVIFDKKASWIRIADSVVGEFDLREDGGPPNLPLSFRDSLSPSLSSMTQRTRARLSFEIRESVAKWVLPARCEIPVHDPYTNSITQKTALCLTRGRRTHLLFSPLPVKVSSAQPLHVIYWKNAPKQVSARICHPCRGSLSSRPRHQTQLPLLQVTAFSQTGLEIYEIPLSALYEGAGGKGKNKLVNINSVRAEEDLGEVGFLQTGGNWDQADELYSQGLERGDGSYSAVSMDSFGTFESEDLLRLLKQEVGMYGWCQKGLEDYRIFWLGGTFDPTDQEDDRDSMYA